MIQSISSSSRYDGIEADSLRKRRRTHNKSKIRPIDAEKNHSDISEPKLCSTPTSLTSSKMINSVAPKDDNIFPIMVTSFQEKRMTPQQEIVGTSIATERSEILISSDQGSDTFPNNNKYKQVGHVDQSERRKAIWEYIFKVLYGFLGILLLTALILPSILVYLLTSKSCQMGLSEISTYTNHCAGISPKSLWQINTTTTITMKLNTSTCHFNDIPVYFVSIAGSSTHYCLTGHGAIYLPTKESFQIYVKDTCFASSGTAMLSYAASYGWDVNWIGFYK